MTSQLFPDGGEHQKLESGEQSGNTHPNNPENPRSDSKNTVPLQTGNSRGTVPQVFPVSHPLKVGNGNPGPILTDIVEHQNAHT